MQRLLIVLGVVLVSVAARADDAPPQPLPTCTLTSGMIVAQDQGTVTIACTGASEALGNQLADVMSRILQYRLDPQTVLVKLDEIERVPDEGVARIVDETQRQTIVQALLGKPAERIGITAHPDVFDSADYARSFATPLLMVGWQIEGHQVRRAAPKTLENVSGVALVVRNRDHAPGQAVRLKSALSAAHIMAPLVTDQTMPEEGTVLWIGKRPTLMGAEQKP